MIFRLVNKVFSSRLLLLEFFSCSKFFILLGLRLLIECDHGLLVWLIDYVSFEYNQRSYFWNYSSFIIRCWNYEHFCYFMQFEWVCISISTRSHWGSIAESFQARRSPPPAPPNRRMPLRLWQLLQEKCKKTLCSQHLPQALERGNGIIE